MATLLSNTKLGNTGVSGLIKSASTLANQIAANQDEAAKITFDNSPKTASDYQTYADYLNGRVTQLLATGSVTDNTKAMTLGQTARTAYNTYVSAEISRQSDNVLEGNASLYDKMATLQNFYNIASDPANGNAALAQTLRGRIDTLNLQIQTAQQTAADSAKTLASANSSAEKGVATTLLEGLQKFNTDYAHAGQKYSQQVLNDYVKSITPQLNALGVHLKPGMTLNAYSVSQGVAQAVVSAYTLAHDAVAPYDPASADTIARDTAKFLGQDGQGGQIPTLAGNMSATTLESAIANPQRFSYVADPEFQGNKGNSGFANQNPQVGYKFDYTKDSNGNPVGVVPVFAPQAWVNVPMKINDIANKLGLQIIGRANGNTIEVAAKAESPDWVKKILGNGNVTTHLVEDQNGNVNFEADSANGKGLAKYLVQGNISGGKYSVYQWGANGYEHIADVGTIGINKNGPGNLALAPSQRLPNGQPDQLAGVFGNLNDFGSVHGMIANAGIQQQISAETAAAAKAMISAPPPPLPNISMAPPQPTTPIAQPGRTSVAMPTYPVAPNTVNPQRPTVNPQTPGGFNLQGGGGIRLQ